MIFEESSNNPFEMAYMLFAYFSALCSGLIVLTGVVFPSMMLTTSRPFSHIIFFISLSDMVGSISQGFGFPDSGSTICSVQAFLFLFFMPSSWIWTSILVFQLRCLLVDKRIWLSLTSCHLIGWGIPLVLSLAPLSTNEYGQDDKANGESVCVLGGGSTEDSRNWTLFGFFGLLVLCCILMTRWTFQIWKHFADTGVKPSDRIYAIFNATRLYPLGMCLTWCPMLIGNIYLELSGREFSSVTLAIMEVLQTQYGTMLCFVFFIYSGEARFEWRRYLCGVEMQHDIFDDNEYSSVRISDNETADDYDDEEYTVNSDSQSFKSCNDNDIDTYELNNALLS